MRLDKYCKVSRLLKRRSVSKELAEHERILINGKVAKASTHVKLQDEITITYGQKSLTVRVLSLLESPRKEEAATLYEVISES